MPNGMKKEVPTELHFLLQFKRFDEIRDIGYHHGTTFFAGLRKASQLSQDSQAGGSKFGGSARGRRNSVSSPTGETNK